MSTELGNSPQEEELLLDQIREDKISYSEIPEEYRLTPKVVALQREKGLRRTRERGYDIISDCFFAEDIVFDLKNTKEYREFNVYSTFKEYYDFLEGDIYQNACYYQYTFSEEEIKRYEIDISKINRDCLTEQRIEKYTFAPSLDEIERYKQVENTKKIIKRWIQKVSACDTYEEFEKVVKRLRKSKVEHLCRKFVYNFIESNKEKTFDIIMESIAKDRMYLGYQITYALCCMYDPEKVLEAFSTVCKGTTSFNNNRSKLKRYITKLKNGEVRFEVFRYFDAETHFFCEELRGYLEQISPCVRIFRYFETLEEFSDYLSGDFSDCDFSKLLFADVDTSKYKVDSKTILPYQDGKELDYRIEKGFDRHSGKFYVNQYWSDWNGNIVKKYRNRFLYFFDFKAFLGGDLSGADLLSCDGFEHITDISDLNLTNVSLRSAVLKQYDFPYAPCAESLCKVQPALYHSELEQTVAPTSERGKLSEQEILVSQKVYYISDLHLMHRIEHAGCRSYEDILYIIRKIVDGLIEHIFNLQPANEENEFQTLIYKSDIDWMKRKKALLIGGDVASNFEVFRLFVSVLRTAVPDSIPIVFVLGNHELWNFSGYSFDQIVSEYRKVLNNNGMYLLQNDLLFKNDDDDHSIQRISNEVLWSMSKKEIRERVKNARLILYGGIGFAGYNNRFNADNGIYRDVIDREEERKQTKRFEQTYHIVCDALADRQVVIFTHMPQNDWCATPKRQSGFVYVSGHTHQNVFYDDGVYRVYADNQMGYFQENSNAKYFYVDDEYDIFSDYKDGIYQISAEQYTEFYRGKNISMTYSRTSGTIYMLKKNNCYCFLYLTPKGRIQMLTGGAVKRLEIQNIQYYFDRMDRVVKHIKTPLDKYTVIQEELSQVIKMIGGSGHIHGCIIDIDYYNHIYVNPIDLTIKGYWALDMRYKMIYPSIPLLLKKECPSLYQNYIKLLGEEKNVSEVNISVREEAEKQPELYLETDIYRYSREIKKMQRLNSNILCTWFEPENGMVEQKTGIESEKLQKRRQ